MAARGGRSPFATHAGGGRILAARGGGGEFNYLRRWNEQVADDYNGRWWRINSDLARVTFGNGDQGISGEGYRCRASWDYCRPLFGLRKDLCSVR